MKQIVRGLNGEDNVVMTFSVIDAKKHFPQTERYVLGFTKENEYALYCYCGANGWSKESGPTDTAPSEPDFWMDFPMYLGRMAPTGETKDTAEN